MASFVYFCSFQATFEVKTLCFSGIRTRIVGVEGEHADHLFVCFVHLKQFVHKKKQSTLAGLKLG